MEDMEIDSTPALDDNQDTFEPITTEFMTEILDTKSRKERLEYFTKRKQEWGRLKRKFVYLKQTHENNIQTAVKQFDKSKNEYDKEAADVEKLKILLSNLEHKIEKFRSDPPSDPLIKREHDVQEYMKVRYERENPEEAILKEKMSIVNGKIANLQAELSQVNDRIDNTKTEIAKFQVPATFVSSGSYLTPVPCENSQLEIPGTAGNYQNRSKTSDRVFLKDRRKK